MIYSDYQSMSWKVCRRMALYSQALRYSLPIEQSTRNKNAIFMDTTTKGLLCLISKQFATVA